MHISPIFFFSNTWLGLVEPEKLRSVCVCVCACVCVPANARKEARVKSLASCCITPSHFVFQTLIEPGTHELVGWLATELQQSSTCPCPPNLLRLQMCPIQLLNWALQDPAPNLWGWCHAGPGSELIERVGYQLGAGGVEGLLSLRETSLSHTHLVSEVQAEPAAEPVSKKPLVETSLPF